MKRTKVFAVPLLCAALVLAAAVPAFATAADENASPYDAAASKATPSGASPSTSASDPIVFLPPGGNNRADPTGDLFSCIGGPPFIYQVNCTATAPGPPPPRLVCDIPTTFIDVGAIPVVANAFECRLASDHHKHSGGGGGGGGGGAAPITQDSSQEVQSGDSSQTFTVTGGGDNSNACQGIQGVSNTGSALNNVGVLQYASDGSVGVSGGNFEISPSSTTTCTDAVNQAASASG